ncbi:peptidase T [Hathewaya histolytica]|uniref:Peptidase T n=1 Tax=Hathewaya histolytica TaxID=1498 RepID=A0A4V6KEF3_HATHI|nr:peptidase T [Hathewaya histolytica]VTQ93967.1 peptidase T [Hathewaya histolytica]
MSNLVKRFLHYVSFDTQSDPNSNTVPSTSKQLILAKEIGKELEGLGMKNVSVDENGYVMAELPANCDKDIPTIGFIAHMDTSPEMPGCNIKPQIVENYDGGDIVLNKEKNIVLTVKDTPDLKKYIGKSIITTDGTTLLGADDKAGIAEIVTAIEYLIEHPEIKHGKVVVGFTPDEEVGKGADHFDVKKFGADFAYTLDGSEVGEFVYETFNAAGAKVTIHGNNVHTGYAKGKMVNSIFLAQEFMSMLPEAERPEKTCGYEGFYHIDSIEGNVEETKLEYIIRDFDREKFESKKETIKKVGEDLNKKYGEGIFEVEVYDQYYNMREKLEPEKHIIDTGIQAVKEVGLEPIVQPIRGGTDGARLSFMGLPTPNIFAGGQNFHSKYEFVPVYSMEKATEVIVKIIEIYANR